MKRPLPDSDEARKQKRERRMTLVAWGLVLVLGVIITVLIVLGRI